MIRHPIFLVYGVFLIGFSTFASFRGWTLGNPSQSRSTPRSIRNNPGGFGPVYSDSPRYSGGK
jgi:hypothetical protein